MITVTKQDSGAGLLIELAYPEAAAEIEALLAETSLEEVERGLLEEHGFYDCALEYGHLTECVYTDNMGGDEVYDYQMRCFWWSDYQIRSWVTVLLRKGKVLIPETNTPTETMVSMTDHIRDLKRGHAEAQAELAAIEARIEALIPAELREARNAAQKALEMLEGDHVGVVDNLRNYLAQGEDLFRTDVLAELGIKFKHSHKVLIRNGTSEAAVASWLLQAAPELAPQIVKVKLTGNIELFRSLRAVGIIDDTSPLEVVPTITPTLPSALTKLGE